MDRALPGQFGGFAVGALPFPGKTAREMGGTHWLGKGSYHVADHRPRDARPWRSIPFQMGGLPRSRGYRTNPDHRHRGGDYNRTVAPTSGHVPKDAGPRGHLTATKQARTSGARFPCRKNSMPAASRAGGRAG